LNVLLDDKEVKFTVEGEEFIFPFDSPCVYADRLFGRKRLLTLSPPPLFLPLFFILIV